MYYKVEYDGYDLSKYMYIQRIRPITANRTASYSQHDYNSGRRLRHIKSEGLTIEVEGVIFDNVFQMRDELVKILYTPTTPRDLIISDQPNRKLKCLFVGGLDLNSRVKNATVKLRFESEKPYWLSTERPKRITANRDGIITANNEGTVNTAPRFDVNFKAECGYLAIVSPSGHIGLGNVKELDKIPVPPTEWAIADDPFNINNGWDRIPNLQNYVTDYIKMSSEGSASNNNGIMQINRSSFTGKTDYWQGHAYTKAFKPGVAHTVAENFHLRTRVNMRDNSGRMLNTCALLIIIQDENHNPIVTTSIYDVTSDRNILNTSFKINSLKDDTKHSTIVHKGTLAGLEGVVEMKKMGNKFSFRIYDEKGYRRVIERLTDSYYSISDVVYIKPTARYGYGEDGSRHSIKDWTRGREYVIRDRRIVNGWWQYNIAHKGVKTYWMYAEDLDGDRQPQVLQGKPQEITFEITNDNLAQMKPARVTIWQAVWGNTAPYTNFKLMSTYVDRIYTVNALEVENVFRPGDTLIVDNQTGDILHNGTTFQGSIDTDSSFFKLDHGESEIQITKSSWANMPEVTMTMEERFG